MSDPSTFNSVTQPSVPVTDPTPQPTSGTDQPGPLDDDEMQVAAAMQLQTEAWSGDPQPGSGADQPRWTVDTESIGHDVLVYPGAELADDALMILKGGDRDRAWLDLVAIVRDHAAVTQERDALRAVVCRMMAGFTPWPDLMEWAGFRDSEPMTEAEAAALGGAHE